MIKLRYDKVHSHRYDKVPVEKTYRVMHVYIGVTSTVNVHRIVATNAHLSTPLK